MTSMLLKVVEHLLFVIGFMFKDDCKYAEDYRLVYVVLLNTAVFHCYHYVGAHTVHTVYVL